MANLPEDVLWNIFTRLRAKQLVQMRCLSRSLKSLISHPLFVKSHLDRWVNNNDGILLVWPHELLIYVEPITAHPCRSPHLELTNFIKLPINPRSNNSRGRVIGSVNGLISFVYWSLHDSATVYIWNPSLSTLLTLPPYSVISEFDDYHISNYFRFGYDPKTNDYKVVNLTQRYGYIDTHVKPEIEIYSMRKGCWELAAQKIPSHIKRVHNRDQICGDGHDGYLHWLAETCNFHWNFILSFDLEAETFREIPLPDFIRYDNAFMYYLGVLAKKLCVMSKVQGGEWEVWVMDEYGVAESWVKYHAFPPFGGGIWPKGFTSHNEFLFRVYPHGLALYDPIAATTKFLNLHAGWVPIDQVVEYVDSLVWVTPAPRV